MNKVKNSVICNSNTHGPPYGQLHIYYLQGRVQFPTGCLGENFIGNWEEDGFSFLFFSKSSDKIVQNFIEKQGGLTLLDQYQMSYDQWQGGRLSCLQINPFLIVPPWESEAITLENRDMTKILLDPGVVFGNGLHATTRDCIEALGWLCSARTVNSALDLGCGTGILALAACKLGCKTCLALDFNLLACQTAIQNVRLNGLANNILVAQARAENFVDLNAELLMANIHYDIMKKIVQVKGFFRKRWFILSGLLRSQAEDIAQQLKRPGVRILKKWERDGIWHTFLGEIHF
jgi:ribosomal protein L11 methyltransferase